MLIVREAIRFSGKPLRTVGQKAGKCTGLMYHHQRSRKVVKYELTVNSNFVILIPMRIHPPFSAMRGDFPFHVEKPSLFLHGEPLASGVP
jgi:hypothetical protein